MAVNAFIILDLTFLVVILASLVFFLRKNKERLSKEGILYLYKTTWGIKLIERIGKKYKKTLEFSAYLSVIVGYLLTKKDT